MSVDCSICVTTGPTETFQEDRSEYLNSTPRACGACPPLKSCRPSVPCLVWIGEQHQAVPSSVRVTTPSPPPTLRRNRGFCGGDLDLHRPLHSLPAGWSVRGRPQLGAELRSPARGPGCGVSAHASSTDSDSITPRRRPSSTPAFDSQFRSYDSPIPKSSRCLTAGPGPCAPRPRRRCGTPWGRFRHNSTSLQRGPRYHRSNVTHSCSKPSSGRSSSLTRQWTTSSSLRPCRAVTGSDRSVVSSSFISTGGWPLAGGTFQRRGRRASHGPMPDGRASSRVRHGRCLPPSPMSHRSTLVARRADA